MNDEYVELTTDTQPLPGDYIRYCDEWGQAKGHGVFVKKITDTQKPLTGSLYLLKDMNTHKMWRVNARRYTFYLRRHQTRGMNLRSLDIIADILKKHAKDHEVSS